MTHNIEQRQEVLSKIDAASDSGGFLIEERVFETDTGVIKLQFRILPNQIEIIDSENRYFQMSASVQPDATGKKFVSFRIYNHVPGNENSKHPLISGKNFIIKAMAFFERTGQKPDYIKDLWQKSGTLISEIASQYAEGLNNQSKENSAKNTWSGQLYSQLGYSNCEVIQDDDDIVIAIFRPDHSSTP